ncbi:MAG: efflux RND transporter periplasmic adaptor subunit [Myxococcota bacterium]
MLYFLLLAACGQDAAAPIPVPTATAVVSEDALCEHGVLAPVCPKCNPALAAVFQAKGDWCPEHGFPMSFCPIHHPEKGGRPSTDVSTDDAPADGTKVRFKSPEVAQRAGLGVAEAEARADEGGFVALATIAWEATRVALVSARAPGVVAELRVDVGSTVRRGQVLAALDSAEVGGGRASIDVARAHVSLAEAELARREGLGPAGAISVAEIDRTRAERDAARAELRSAEAALGMVGAGEGTAGRYTLSAPLSGVVTRREAVVGGHVEGSAVLFEVVDPSSVWADIEVPEADLARVAVGRRVVFSAEMLGDRTFEGTIASIAPAIDPAKRTVLARAALLNPDGLLRANLFGQVRIATPDTAAVAVPAAALQRAKGKDLVFVRLEEGLYEARRVEVAARQGETVVLRRGVAPGEDVVTDGSFLLKTETLKDSIGAGCCDVE